LSRRLSRDGNMRRTASASTEVSDGVEVEAKRKVYDVGVASTSSHSVAGSAIATTLCHHTHIYIAALVHRYSINSVLHFPSPLYVRHSLHAAQRSPNTSRRTPRDRDTRFIVFFGRIWRYYGSLGCGSHGLSFLWHSYSSYVIGGHASTPLYRVHSFLNTIPSFPSPYHNLAVGLPRTTSYLYLKHIDASLRLAPRLALHNQGKFIQRVCRYAFQSPSTCFTQLQSTVYLCRASPSWNSTPRVRRKLAPRTFPAQCRIVSDRSSAILFSPIRRHCLSDVPGFCILPVPLCSAPHPRRQIYNVRR
jgi:hypothetical protein